MGSPTTMGKVGMAVSVLAIIVAVVQGTVLTKYGKDFIEPLNLESCEEDLAETEKTMNEINALNDMDEQETGYKDVAELFKRISRLQFTSKEMECDQDSTFKAKMDALMDGN